MKNMNLSENKVCSTNSNIDDIMFSGWTKKGLIKELEHLDKIGKELRGPTCGNLFSACLDVINYLESMLKLAEIELSSSYDEIGELKVKLKSIKK